MSNLRYFQAIFSPSAIKWWSALYVLIILFYGSYVDMASCLWKHTRDARRQFYISQDWLARSNCIPCGVVLRSGSGNLNRGISGIAA